MKDIVDGAGRRDAVDHLVDSLLEDPTRADDIKSKLRETLGAPVHPGPVRQTAAVYASDADEFWENFPV